MNVEFIYAHQFERDMIKTIKWFSSSVHRVSVYIFVHLNEWVSEWVSVCAYFFINISMCENRFKSI